MHRTEKGSGCVSAGTRCEVIVMKTRDYELVLDSLQMTGIYVIREDTHEILYFNKRVREVSPGIKKGMVCHVLWKGSCSSCPLLTIGDRKESRSISYDHPFGKMVDIVATRILWEGNIPAFSIAVTPHADAASSVYSRILKINLSTDSAEIIQTGRRERINSEGPCTSLSHWFELMVEEGNIFSGDEERVRKFIRLEHLREALKGGTDTAVCTYRRREGSGYRWHTMEVVPDYNYREDSQTAMLYVKDVHDVYREGLELEEVNHQNQEIIKFLGEMNFGIYVVDLHTGTVNPIRLADDLRELISTEIMEWDDMFRILLHNFYHPDYWKELWDAYSLQALRTAQHEGGQNRSVFCKRKLHGSYHYVSTASRFLTGSGEQRYVVVAMQDVDEQTRRELDHSQKDQRMATIIRSGYDAMYTLHLDTGICERDFQSEGDNTARVQMGDYEECIRKSVPYIHEEDAAAFYEMFSIKSIRDKAARAGEYQELVHQFRCKGAPVRWMENHVFFIRQNRNMRVNILCRDITKEKEQEESVRKERSERNQVINSMGSLFFTVYYLDLSSDSYRIVKGVRDTDELLRTVDHCTEGFLAYAKHFVHPDHRAEFLEKMNCAYMREHLSQEHPFYAVEYRRIREVGDSIVEDGWLRATAVLAELKDGEPDKVLYVTQVVTESKEKEEREQSLLKEACDAAVHANAAKSEFLSRMSHDIRTPMNAIIGMTAIAGTHLDERERVSDCLGKITTASRHLLSLINEVLDMSKIESGKITLTEEEFNLSELIQSVLTMVRPVVEKKQHHLEVHVSGIEHEDVVGDVMRLQQVFMNIMSNSVKYTPPGGMLELEISEKPSKIHGYGCYEFIFTDNGIGMSQEYLSQIFEPFSRAEDNRVSKIEGTGLGMTIARNIVQMMNGSIGIESKEGEGSRFTVTIYLKQQNTMRLDQEHFADLPVLVVDDNQCDCEAACAILDDIGMKSEWVLSGREAVSRVAEARETDNAFFAVLVDWRMPDMDGVQTAREIRKIVGPDVTIIVLSAYDWGDIEHEARQAGVDGFISKPMFKSRLVYLLKEIQGGSERIAAEDREKEKTYDFSGRRVLLVEDNELNMEIAEEFIRHTGVLVERATDGRMAVDMFREREEGYYDLIFMDIQMPYMNGYEATRAIRALERRDAAAVPIIAMTADAFTEDIIASRSAGMNEHISKPLSMDLVLSCMNKWLNRGIDSGNAGSE